MPSPLTPSPLLKWPDAVPASWPDEGVAAHYGDPAREQRALDTAVGFVDRSNRGVVTVTGPDRLSWLHSLTSQHLEKLQPGDSAQALILDPNGHVEHHLTLTDDGTTAWIHTEPGRALPDRPGPSAAALDRPGPSAAALDRPGPSAAASLAAFLDSMRFMLRVEVADVTPDYAVLSLLGPDRGDLAAGAGGIPVGATTDRSSVMDLILPRERLAVTAEDLVRRGAAAAGMWAFEALRIAAHEPRLGVDTDQRTIPHEVGWIDTAVHLNKGCYRGQETVARVHNLGHPPRRLVFLDLDGSVDRLPGHGDPVELDGAVVGTTGSAARHYELGPIALALVKRTVPVDATLLAGGIAAAQEVIVPPDAGGNVKVTLRKRTIV